MMSSRQKWCADNTLALAIRLAVKESGKSEQDVLHDFLSADVYDALYDETTGLWAAGPAYLLDFARNCGMETDNSRIVNGS